MSFGKKILSAFVEIDEDNEVENLTTPSEDTRDVADSKPIKQNTVNPTEEDIQKFKNYFDNLLNDSKSSGPDFFAFSKMIEAMTVIADEKARYIAAFAGLAAQGLSKTTLIESANQFLEVLENDAVHFTGTVNATFEEKVLSKKQAVEEKTKKIQELSRDITDLDNQISLLKLQIEEDEEKINSNANGYKNESDSLKNKIGQELEKIKKYLN